MIAATVGIGCQVSTTDAPDGAKLKLSFSHGATVTASDTCTILSILELETGDRADEGWTIDLSADGGLFVGQSSQFARLKTDESGIVRVTFKAPSDTGWVHIDGATFGSKIRDSLHIVPAVTSK
jgi:hypothetical protein